MLYHLLEGLQTYIFQNPAENQKASKQPCQGSEIQSYILPKGRSISHHSETTYVYERHHLISLVTWFSNSKQHTTKEVGKIGEERIGHFNSQKTNRK